jgi:trehalose 6-phosphate phosphatase
VGPLPTALRPLAERPSAAALFVDFDGTIAPIVHDPDQARPAPGATAVLARLVRILGLVAVVSGRPIGFLSEVLGPSPGLQVVGLYGLEWIDPYGSWRVEPSAEQWRPVVGRVVQQARSAAPPGLTVEEKGLSTALHWRGRPTAESWARSFARSIEDETGLVASSGRMSLELRPPLTIDKGTVVERLGAPFGAIACFGDDLGDLPAFAALDRLAAGGAAVARVAVVDQESPEAVRAAADVVVAGPRGALDLLGGLAVLAEGRERRSTR